MGEIARRGAYRRRVLRIGGGPRAEIRTCRWRARDDGGGEPGHDRIAGNAIRVVGYHLQGHRCQPFTSDTYVKIPAGNRRQADMGVDRSPFEDASLDASEPVLVLEILSLTTRTFDRNDKLKEYKTVSTLEYILLVDPDYPQVRLYRRGDDRNWTSDRLTGLASLVEIPRLGLRLPLGDLYSGQVFRTRPTLVEPADDPASKFSI
jgi:Uma2 family endonuclease